MVIRAYAGSCLEEVDQCLSLSGEAVDYVLGVVGDRGLEEERQVGEDGAEGLAIDFNSGEEFSKDEHVDHDGDSKERVLTDVV